MPDRHPHQRDRALVIASVLLCILAIAETACANPITPPVLLPGASGLIRFLFANAIIGLLEGLLIAQCFGTYHRSAIVIMILANCFSGVMGFVLADLMPENPLRFGTYAFVESWLTLILAILAYFVAAVVLEWPFCYWLLRFHDRHMRAASLACITAQAGSYLVLIVFFNMVN